MIGIIDILRRRQGIASRGKDGAAIVRNRDPTRTPYSAAIGIRRSRGKPSLHDGGWNGVVRSDINLNKLSLVARQITLAAGDDIEYAVQSVVRRTAVHEGNPIRVRRIHDLQRIPIQWPAGIEGKGEKRPVCRYQENAVVSPIDGRGTNNAHAAAREIAAAGFGGNLRHP